MINVAIEMTFAVLMSINKVMIQRFDTKVVIQI